jgi:hypothetical protein
MLGTVPLNAGMVVLHALELTGRVDYARFVIPARFEFVFLVDDVKALQFKGY